MFCCLVILLSYCSLAPLPCLHSRLAVVVFEATHPITPQYLINIYKSERTKIVPKRLDKIYYKSASKKANGKVLYTTFRY
jgi:hypothetical protein